MFGWRQSVRGRLGDRHLAAMFGVVGVQSAMQNNGLRQPLRIPTETFYDARTHALTAAANAGKIFPVNVQSLPYDVINTEQRQAGITSKPGKYQHAPLWERCDIQSKCRRYFDAYISLPIFRLIIPLIT